MFKVQGVEDAGSGYRLKKLSVLLETTGFFLKVTPCPAARQIGALPTLAGSVLLQVLKLFFQEH